MMEPAMTTERRVQYEFKVIVQVSEDVWPEELRHRIFGLINGGEIWVTGEYDDIIMAQSVERVRDYT